MLTENSVSFCVSEIHGLTRDRRNDPYRCADDGLLEQGCVGHVRFSSNGKQRYDGDGKDGKVRRLYNNQWTVPIQKLNALLWLTCTDHCPTQPLIVHAVPCVSMR
jgi:hypothetical protein